jgi:PAS domain S-box-containing protein
MKKVPEGKRGDAANRIEQLEIEVSILRGAYFQLEKAVVERKKAEEKVAESEEKFRNLFEGANDGFIFLDRAGKILEVNRKATEIFGGPKKELLGKHFIKLAIFSPSDIPRLMSNFKNILAGKVVSLEIRIKNRKNQVVDLESSTNLLKIGGKTLGMMVIVRDITKRKKAERELQESTKSLAKAQHLAHLGNWDWDIVTNKLWWSDEIYRIFGLKPQQFGATYEGFIERIHPEDRESVKSAINEALKKNNYSIDHRIVLPNGKLRTVHEEAEVTYDKSGKPSRMLGTVLDITEIKKAEEELRELTGELRKEKESVERKVVERTKELRETQKRELALKDEFVFIASHDLRTPVTAINGYIDLIKESKEKFSKDTEENFDAVEEASRRLDQLVDDLLQVARSESGTIKAKVSSVDIVELIKKGTRQITPQADKKKISIEINLDHSNRHVLADEEKLSEVIENLLSNAVKFNREKGKIVLTSTKIKDKLQVDVSDTGYGIPKDQQDKVFGKFFKARTEETKGIPGTGLGLFVVRMLVEKMGGKITFTSEEGRGTTFTVVFPIEKSTSS